MVFISLALTNCMNSHVLIVIEATHPYVAERNAPRSYIRTCVPRLWFPRAELPGHPRRIRRRWVLLSDEKGPAFKIDRAFTEWDKFMFKGHLTQGHPHVNFRPSFLRDLTYHPQWCPRKPIEQLWWLIAPHLSRCWELDVVVDWIGTSYAQSTKKKVSKRIALRITSVYNYMYKPFWFSVYCLQLFHGSRSLSAQRENRVEMRSKPRQQEIFTVAYVHIIFQLRLKRKHNKRRNFISITHT